MSWQLLCVCVSSLAQIILFTYLLAISMQHSRGLSASPVPNEIHHCLPQVCPCFGREAVYLQLPTPEAWNGTLDFTPLSLTAHLYHSRKPYQFYHLHVSLFCPFLALSATAVIPDITSCLLEQPQESPQLVSWLQSRPSSLVSSTLPLEWWFPNSNVSTLQCSKHLNDSQPQ